MTEPVERIHGPHQGQPVLAAGIALDQAEAAMILIHGRGASAQDILDLARVLDDPRYAYLAPQAAGNTWYPNSFLAPIDSNEPGLSSGLQALDDLVAQAEAAGIPAERIVLGGFSQGACLASEYAARNARRYGGLLVFSGGVIGPPGALRTYTGSVGQHARAHRLQRYGSAHPARTRAGDGGRVHGIGRRRIAAGLSRHGPHHQPG